MSDIKESYHAAVAKLDRQRRAYSNALSIASRSPSDENIQEAINASQRVVEATSEYLSVVQAQSQIRAIENSVA